VTLRQAIAIAVSIAALSLAGMSLAACGSDDDGDSDDATVAPEPTTRQPGPTDGADEAGDLARAPKPRLSTVATGLVAPWELAFLPDGDALLTERPGRVRHLSADGELDSEPVAEIPVAEMAEAGLLGLAVDPDFSRNGLVYLYRTSDAGNEVVRYRYRDGELREQATVLDGIEAAPIHDGGRIHFGPDDRLYVTTGDAGQDQLSQEEGSRNGKLLALAPGQYRGGGGEPEVVSIGHRNAQGFDWDPETERLYATEHGPDCCDEVNLIEQGENYGWPDAFGADHQGFASPLTIYEQPIAPSGGSFVSLPGSAWTGDFIFGALIGEQVRRLRFDGREVVQNEALFEGELGRVRTVVEGPDGALYALTSNRDGRGSPSSEDDRVIRIVPPEG
jgi:glucose/arabinose dehydrogenase